METIASRLEAIATSNKKLLVAKNFLGNRFTGNRFTCRRKELVASPPSPDPLATDSPPSPSLQQSWNWIILDRMVPRALGRGLSSTNSVELHLHVGDRGVAPPPLPQLTSPSLLRCRTSGGRLIDFVGVMTSLGGAHDEQWHIEMCRSGQ